MNYDGDTPMQVQNSKFKIQKYRSKAKNINHSVILAGARMTKRKTFYFLLVLLTFTFCLLPSGSASAASVSNENFEINIDQLDVAPEEQKKLPTPTPQPVENGNFGIATLPYAFSFSVSAPLLDFGVLSATNPVTRNATLTVSSPGNGYQVFAYQDHTLLSKKNALIPDTTCDNGSCSEITPSIWQNNLTYGFGFRCDSITKNACFEEFEAENTYKQFSDKGKKEIPQPIMLSESPVSDQQAKLTYRVNISGTQTREAYANTVTYIAVPNF